MRVPFKVTHLVTLVVLGSGLINIFSVIGPALPERAVIIHGIFPLEFVHLSRFLSLLTGFALGVHTRTPVLSLGDQALARTERFISREFGQHISLMDLASTAGVSRQHLLKLFRNRRGTTPTQYLYQRRLRVAADQLTHTGLSIKEIAGHCGFANAFHFSRKFKAAYRMSPRAWRSQRWSSAGLISPAEAEKQARRSAGFPAGDNLRSPGIHEHDDRR